MTGIVLHARSSKTKSLEYITRYVQHRLIKLILDKVEFREKKEALMMSILRPLNTLQINSLLYHFPQWTHISQSSNMFFQQI
jgi:hypothetical protein